MNIPALLGHRVATGKITGNPPKGDTTTWFALWVIGSIALLLVLLIILVCYA